MASRPRRNVLIEALTGMARAELGEHATALDLVCDRLASGTTITKLAVEVGAVIGPNWHGEGSGPWVPSRNFVSTVAHSLAPDADARIEAARKQGAYALAEGGLDIADNSPTVSTAEVQKSRLRIDQRNALAAAFMPEVFKDRPVAQVSIDLGLAHILAIQNAPRLGLPASERQPQQQLEPMPAEIVSSDEMPALSPGSQD